MSTGVEGDDVVIVVFKNDGVGGDDDIIVFEALIDPPPVTCKLDELPDGDDDKIGFVGLFGNINDVE